MWYIDINILDIDISIFHPISILSISFDVFSITSVAYSISLLWGSAVSTCCAGLFRCTVRATLFPHRSIGCGQCGFKLLMVQLPWTSSINGWDLEGGRLSSHNWRRLHYHLALLTTVTGLFSILLNCSSSFSRCFWRGRTFYWTFCGISCRCSAICCSVLTVNVFRSSCW